MNESTAVQEPASHYPEKIPWVGGACLTLLLHKKGRPPVLGTSPTLVLFHFCPIRKEEVNKA